MSSLAVRPLPSAKGGRNRLGLLEVIGETGTLAGARTRELWRLAHEANVAICKRRPQRAVLSDMAQQLLVGIEAPLLVFPKSHARHSPFTLGLFHLPDSSTKYYGR